MPYDSIDGHNFEVVNNFVCLGANAAMYCALKSNAEWVFKMQSSELR